MIDVACTPTHIHIHILVWTERDHIWNPRGSRGRGARPSNTQSIMRYGPHSWRVCDRHSSKDTMDAPIREGRLAHTQYVWGDGMASRIQSIAGAAVLLSHAAADALRPVALISTAASCLGSCTACGYSTWVGDPAAHAAMALPIRMY